MTKAERLREIAARMRARAAKIKATHDAPGGYYHVPGDEPMDYVLDDEIVPWADEIEAALAEPSAHVRSEPPEDLVSAISWTVAELQSCEESTVSLTPAEAGRIWRALDRSMYKHRGDINAADTKAERDFYEAARNIGDDMGECLAYGPAKQQAYLCGWKITETFAKRLEMFCETYRALLEEEEKRNDATGGGLAIGTEDIAGAERETTVPPSDLTKGGESVRLSPMRPPASEPKRGLPVSVTVKDGVTTSEVTIPFTAPFATPEPDYLEGGLLRCGKCHSVIGRDYDALPIGKAEPASPP